MERPIPLVMLALAILGFCYMLVPIVIVVLSGLNCRRVPDLSAAGPVAALGHRLPAVGKNTSPPSSSRSGWRWMTMVVATVLGTAAAIFLSRTRFFRAGGDAVVLPVAGGAARAW